MDARVEDILDKAGTNDYFRQVLLTGEKTQSVIMSLKPGEDIGAEVHPNNEQVLLCVEGSGRAILAGDELEFNSGDLVVVRAGTDHNFINTGASSMKIVTIYSPPDHKDGIVHKTKAEALQEE